MRSLFVLFILSLAPQSLIPGALAAAGLTDQIMPAGLYRGWSEGERLDYRLSRSLAPEPEGGWPGAGHGIRLPEAVSGGILSLARSAAGEGGGLELRLDPGEGAGMRVLSALSPEAPNPVLLFWLENTVRAASVQTGGSPFWFRNRIREALVSASSAAEEKGEYRVILTPFADLGPAEAQNLGAFAGLRLEIAWGAAGPGALTELKADAPAPEAGAAEAAPAGGYHEHLILEEAE